jgi:hypothetical protein
MVSVASTTGVVNELGMANLLASPDGSRTRRAPIGSCPAVAYVPESRPVEVRSSNDPLRALAAHVPAIPESNPFETHAGRLHTIGLAVKSSVYSCIVIVVYLSLNFTLRLLDLQRWEPFALSVFLVICALVASMGYAAPLRKPEVDGLAT